MARISTSLHFLTPPTLHGFTLLLVFLVLGDPNLFNIYGGHRSSSGLCHSSPLTDAAREALGGQTPRHTAWK